MSKRLKHIYIAAFFLYLTAVGLLCFIRPSSLPEVDIMTIFGIPVDKAVHFLMFLPYPILAGLAFIDKERHALVNIFVLLMLAVIGVGIAYGTEIVQLYSGYRSYDIADFRSDIKGIAAGAVLAIAYQTYIKLKK